MQIKGYKLETILMRMITKLSKRLTFQAIWSIVIGYRIIF